MVVLEKLNACPGVMVTKGCGAMGADTVLAVVDREFRSEFYAAVKDLGWMRRLNDGSRASSATEGEPMTWKAKAPSNIALIKYMGKIKTEGNRTDQSVALVHAAAFYH